jgi:hypothetical protein
MLMWLEPWRTGAWTSRLDTRTVQLYVLPRLRTAEEARLCSIGSSRHQVHVCAGYAMPMGCRTQWTTRRSVVPLAVSRKVTSQVSQGCVLISGAYVGCWLHVATPIWPGRRAPLSHTLEYHPPSCISEIFQGWAATGTPAVGGPLRPHSTALPVPPSLRAQGSVCLSSSSSCGGMLKQGVRATQSKYAPVLQIEPQIPSIFKHNRVSNHNLGAQPRKLQILGAC